jgi:hypothetical protein
MKVVMTAMAAWPDRPDKNPGPFRHISMATAPAHPGEQSSSFANIFPALPAPAQKINPTNKFFIP